MNYLLRADCEAARPHHLGLQAALRLIPASLVVIAAMLGLYVREASAQVLPPALDAEDIQRLHQCAASLL